MGYAEEAERDEQRPRQAAVPTQEQSEFVGVLRVGLVRGVAQGELHDLVLALEEAGVAEQRAQVLQVGPCFAYVPFTPSNEPSPDVSFGRRFR